MDEQFWHKKWESKDIAFHAATPNPLLLSYFDRLGLANNARVFLPLCGKTLDIGWLLNQGYRVAGAELSTIAAEELFSELGFTPMRSELGAVQRYQAHHLDIFVGDIFALTSELLGPVDAIYDRAALVALPDTLRAAYTTLLKEITHTAPQLLINYDYDQSKLAGPPFSISDEELAHHYSGHYQSTLLSSEEVVGGLKGQCPTQEKLWLLKACL
ncbi:thiopurine S-methyltransferase [Zhongshania sp.]|uniref:thiopurine S-methyltransferase n=1 Tax=Zhongshania sp. TaxID=1971902 RepID=UPI0035658296